MILYKKQNDDHAFYQIKYQNKIYSVIVPETNTWVGKAGVKLCIRDSDNNLIQDKDMQEHVQKIMDSMEKLQKHKENMMQIRSNQGWSSKEEAMEQCKKVQKQA